MLGAAKNWDEHVAHAEEVARTPGFAQMRAEVLAALGPAAGQVVVDLGAGTGLLTLALAGEAEHVWAIDISPLMCEYLRTKAASAGLGNTSVAIASATSLPLVDNFADAIVSNYCLHHLRDEDKLRALAEMRRVLRPGGRLVIGDMFFRIGAQTERDRRLVRQKLRAMLRRGLPGLVRVGRHAVRHLTGRGEHPASGGWWRDALVRAGFADVELVLLEHEGGIVSGRRPATQAPARDGARAA